MIQQIFTAGERATFGSNYVTAFTAETTNISEEVTQYQKLVLAGIDQVGIVKEYGSAMTTVSYDDGWELPIPTKYLVLLPQTKE